MIWINAYKMYNIASTIRYSNSQICHISAKSLLLRIVIMLQILLKNQAILTQVPADHLLPPPLPQTAAFIPQAPPNAPLLPNPLALTHNKRPIPIYSDVPPNFTTPGVDQAGIMHRIARWFGFAGNTQEQQLVAAGTMKQPAYSYTKPHEQLNYNQKAPCNLCNKYPWIPMMPLSVQYPPIQQQQQGYQQTQWQQQQQHAQASKHTPAFLPVQQPVKQRAVHFNFPTVYQNFQAKGPLHQPTLTTNPSPPIFNAQPFHSTTTTTTTHPLFIEQQLPTTEPAHFNENVGAHSELKAEQVRPNISTYETPNVEIFKSQQITDFVSSVEYPATFVQAQSIDLNIEQQTQAPKMPDNHKPDNETPIGTVRYQHVPAHISNHIPASQLLTDPSSLSTTVSFETTNSPQITPTFALANHKQYEEPTSSDNYPSASSLNNHNFYHTNDISYTTTEYPAQTEFFTTSEKSTVEFAPSIEIKQSFQNHKQISKDRGTPKQLLDAPIQHAQYNLISSPRPFTRDPSDLDYRFGAVSSNQQQPQQQSQTITTKTPLMPTVTPAPIFSVSSAQPTSTSTYGALDASGHYAGMSPPAPVPAASKTVQQIIVPYTTKSRPRPFEPARNAIESTTQAGSLGTISDKWLQNHVDLHEQQESKLVLNTAANNPTTTTSPPTTKYITKVLASNLRELLRREQAFKNRSNSHAGFDLRKLQKNIDDWTEQEYTSLSHRPSTPTIRGRSKHIPAAYLTTTTTTAPPTESLKSDRIFDSTALSTSINNLQSFKNIARNSKPFEYSQIEDNVINDLDSMVTKATTTIITPTTSSAKHTTPIYVRPISTETPPEILWQKAKVLISPDTHEKVYVVTPQPRFFPQRRITTSTEIPMHKSTSSSQKTGRFIVRPTPGNGSSNSTATSNNTVDLFSPAPFGLSGLTTFVPAQPVEIIDGNSKVVKIVTPFLNHKKATKGTTINMGRSIRTDYVTINRSRTKPTMSPSPR